MTVAKKSKRPEADWSAEERVAGFIAKFEPKHQALIRAVRRALRRRLSPAFEFVYDNYNFLVFGYGPSERPSDAVLSIAAGANGVSLCFLHGAKLADPQRVLLGSGKQTRFMRVPSVAALEEPGIVELIMAAVSRSKVPWVTRGRVQLVIRSVSEKQRPRRR